MNDAVLTGLTSLFNLLFLISSLWLGMYIVSRNPKDKKAWLVSAALWSLSGSFLNTLTLLHTFAGGEDLPWWWGWSAAFAVPFWFHLSVTLLPSERQKQQQTLVVLSYLLTLNLVAMEAYTPLIFTGTGAGSPIDYSFQRPGRLFPLYGLYLILAPGLSLWNFRRGWRDTTNTMLRKQYGLFQIASFLALVAGIYASVSIWLHLATPILLTTILLGSGVLLLAYSVVRWNTLVEGRVHRQDLLYSAAAAGVIAAGYLLIALLSNLAFRVPFIAYIFLVCFAIATHVLYDFGLEKLDQYITRRRGLSGLRSRLRDVARKSRLEPDLDERLQTLLRALCTALQIRHGWIVLHGDENRVIGIRNEANAMLPAVHKKMDGGEIQILAARDDQNGGSTLIAPMLHGGVRLGAIILGPEPSVQFLSDEDLDLIEEFTDRVASVVHIAALQQSTVARIETMAQQYEKRETELQEQMRSALRSGSAKPSPESLEEAELNELVEDALRHVGDYSYLGRHALARFEVVAALMACEKPEIITHLDRGKALQELLRTCIDKLKPSGSQPDPPTREWRPYIILQDCYVQDIMTRDVMNSLYISEATFHRARRRAVKAVARAIGELERSAQASQFS